MFYIKKIIIKYKNSTVADWVVKPVSSDNTKLKKKSERNTVRNILIIHIKMKLPLAI